MIDRPKRTIRKPIRYQKGSDDTPEKTGQPSAEQPKIRIRLPSKELPVKVPLFKVCQKCNIAYSNHLFPADDELVSDNLCRQCVIINEILFGLL